MSVSATQLHRPRSPVSWAPRTHQRHPIPRLGELGQSVGVASPGKVLKRSYPSNGRAVCERARSRGPELSAGSDVDCVRPDDRTIAVASHACETRKAQPRLVKQRVHGRERWCLVVLREEGNLDQYARSPL